MSYFVKEMKKRQKEEERLDKSSSKNHNYYNKFKEVTEILSVMLSLTSEFKVFRVQNVIYIEGELEKSNIRNSYTPHSFAYFFGNFASRKKIEVSRYKRNSLLIEFNFELSNDCEERIKHFMTDNIFIKPGLRMNITIKNMKQSIKDGTLNNLIFTLVDNMSNDKLGII